MFPFDDVIMVLNSGNVNKTSNSCGIKQAYIFDSNNDFSNMSLLYPILKQKYISKLKKIYVYIPSSLEYKTHLSWQLSDVVGAAPVGAAPTTSSFST